MLTDKYKNTIRLFKPLWFCLAIYSVFILTGCKAYYNAYYTDPVKCYKVACDSRPYDVVIVPGFPSDSGKINGVLAERILWGDYLYRKGFAKHIIFSGSAVYSPFVESKIMRLYAIQLGVKPEDIFVETKAEHTTENIYYSYKLAESMGFTKIAFASQAAHTSFMKPFARKFKLKLDFIPILTDSVRSLPDHFGLINASEAFKPDFVSIEKRQGILTRFMGTRGHRVKVEMRKEKKLARKQNKV